MRICVAYILLAGAILAGGCRDQDAPPPEAPDSAAEPAESIPGPTSPHEPDPTDRLASALRTVRRSLQAGGQDLGRLHARLDRFLQRMTPSPSETAHRAAARAFYQGRYDLAIDRIRSGLARSPDDLNLLRQLATVQTVAGRHEKAAATCRRILQLAPGDREVWFNLAVALTRLGQMNEAETIYRSLLRDRPDDMESRSNLVGLLLHASRHGEARRQLEILIQRHPEAPSPRAMMAELLGDLGKHRDAMAHYAKLTQMEPRRIDHWQGFALAAARAGSLGRALYATEQAVKLADASGPGARNLAEMVVSGLDSAGCGRTELLDLAQLAVQSRLRMSRLRWWARLHQSLGDIRATISRHADAPHLRPKALDAWRRSLQIWPDQPVLRARAARLGSASAEN